MNIARAARRLVKTRRLFVLFSALVLGVVALLVSSRSAHAQLDLHVDGSGIDKPLLYMKFDEFPFTVTRSYPNTAITGTLVSGAVLSTTTPSSFSPPNFGSVRLSGSSNDHVKILDNATTAPLKSLTNQITVAAWVRRTAFGTVDTVYAHGSSPGNVDPNNWSLQFNSANRLVFRVGQTTVMSSSTTILDTNWHHLAATVVDSGAGNLYIDGALRDSRANVNLPATIVGHYLIGARNEDVAGQQLPGLIDELRLYNRVLSQTEITNLAAGRGCATSGLSWSEAFFDLQCALDPIFDGDGRTIRVATGIYRPGTTSRATYPLQDGVTILGGFVPNAPGGPMRVDFSPFVLANPTFPLVLNITQLSGDLLANDANGFLNRIDNADVVVTSAGDTGWTIDGLAIGGGTRGMHVFALSSGSLSTVYMALNGSVTGNPSALRVEGDSHLEAVNAVLQFNAAPATGTAGIEVVGANTALTLTQALVVDSFNGRGLQVAAGASALLQDLQVLRNQAQTGGGLALSSADVVLNDVRISGNSASTTGGGLLASASTLQVISATVEGNTAQFGAGLFVNGNGGRLDNLVVTNNQALAGCGSVAFCGHGGGLLVGGSLEIGPSVVISGNAATRGAGIQVEGFANLTIDGSQIRNNRVITPTAPVADFEPLEGGGLHARANATITMTNALFEDNQALTYGTGFDAPLGQGGAIFLAPDARLVATGGVIRDSLATGDGGGIHAAAGSQILLQGLLLEGNAAVEGGGLHVVDGQVTLTDTLLRRNLGTNDSGGGASISGSSLFTMTGGGFVENRILDNEGGAAIFYDNVEASLRGVRFLGNLGQSHAGALAVFGDTVVTLVNALMVGNTITSASADNSANVFIVDGGALRLLNSTVVANTGPGNTGALVNAGTLLLRNSILRDNGATQVVGDPLATVAVEASSLSLPGTAGDPLFLATPNPGDGNWATFADNNYGDLHLRALSPEIDAGNGALLLPDLTTDLDGQPRVFDVLYAPDLAPPPVDRGAFEVRFVAPTAVAGGPYLGTAGAPVALNAAASSDDVGIATYQWDCFNDGSFEVTAATPIGSSCTYPAAGAFTLRLVVTDGDGLSAQATTAVTIQAGGTPEPPSVFLHLPAVYGPP